MSGALLRRLCSRREWSLRLARWRDTWQGVDFERVVKAEELGYGAEAHDYTPSGDRYLKRMLDGLEIRSTDCIIDVGCGKGSAMRMMLKFPFARVDGLDLSEELAGTARRNFSRLRVAAERWRVIAADAAEFRDLDDYNFVYLYNPFGPTTMQRFLQNLAASLQRKPRRVTLIYDNPVYHPVLAASGLFSLETTQHRDATGNAIYVYVTASRPAAPPRASPLSRC